MSRLPSLEDGREPFLPEPTEMGILKLPVSSGKPDLNNYLINKQEKAKNEKQQNTYAINLKQSLQQLPRFAAN